MEYTASDIVSASDIANIAQDAVTAITDPAELCKQARQTMGASFPCPGETAFTRDACLQLKQQFPQIPIGECPATPSSMPSWLPWVVIGVAAYLILK